MDEKKARYRTYTRQSTGGVANLVGLPKDLTTERTEITEKKLLNISVDSVISVVRGFLSPSF